MRGIVLGNTWFWPAADVPTKAFSRVMGSPPMQWAILHRNFLVERLIPAGTATRLSKNRDVPAKLGSKRALLVWGMKDPAFRPGANLPRMRSAFSDHVLVELPNAAHFIQEDEPDRIADAIIERFG